MPDDENPQIDRPETGSLHPEYPRDGGVEGPILIANEFVDVVVNKVETRNGMRLDIWSPKRGTRVQFDAVALDCLSFQQPEFITEMLTRHPTAY